MEGTQEIDSISIRSQGPLTHIAVGMRTSCESPDHQGKGDTAPVPKVLHHHRLPSWLLGAMRASLQAELGRPENPAAPSFRAGPPSVNPRIALTLPAPGGFLPSFPQQIFPEHLPMSPPVLGAGDPAGTKPDSSCPQRAYILVGETLGHEAKHTAVDQKSTQHCKSTTRQLNFFKVFKLRKKQKQNTNCKKKSRRSSKTQTHRNKLGSEGW